MSNEYTFDVEYDSIDCTYILTVYDPDSDEVVDEYYELEDAQDVVNVLIGDFGVIPTEETINDITSLSMYEDNEDDIEYEYEDEYEE
jgi:predicted secreted protein